MPRRKSSTHTPASTDDDQMRFVHKRSRKLVLLIRQVPLDDGQVLGPTNPRVQSQPVRRDPIDVSFAISQRVVQEDDPADSDDSEKGGYDESDKEARPFVSLGDETREGG
jgi:hypothetical protein